MKHVRLPLTSREFLMTHVDSENLVRENTECKELLLEAMRYHLMPEQRSSLTTIRTTSRYILTFLTFNFWPSFETLHTIGCKSAVFCTIEIWNRLNTSYLTNSYIVFTLKMESVSKIKNFGLKMMVKSGLEKIFFWNSSMRQTTFP